MLFRDESEFHRGALGKTFLDRVSGWILTQIENVARPAIAVGAYLILCWLFQRLAPDFHLYPQQWSWNLAAGLSFGFLLAFGLSYVPVVLVAYLAPLLADGSMVVSTWEATVFAVGSTVAVGGACYAADRIVSAPVVDLTDRRTLVSILALIPLTAIVAALLTTLTWWFAGALLPNTFMETFLIKIFGNGMGLLVAGPFVLLNGIPLLNGAVERSNPFAAFETGDLAQGALLLHITAGAVVATSVVGMDRFEAYLLLSVPLIGMALKFGVQGAAAGFLVVGCAGSAVRFFGYTALDGLFMEIPILVALITTLTVAALATERTRAVETARRQAALIMDAAREEEDLKHVLKRLIQEVEATNLQITELQDDAEEAEHERVLERLDELARP